MRRSLFAAATAAGLALSAQAGAAEAIHAPSVNWSFHGLFGTFDRAALQRGYQVYAEVCSSCHSLNLLYYRNLRAIGLSEERVKEIAGNVEVTDGPNDDGDMFERPGRPSDRFKAPFANAKAAAAANGGAVPPDLSLIVKAREGGADHVYAVLALGYEDQASDDVLKRIFESETAKHLQTYQDELATYEEELERYQAATTRGETPSKPAKPEKPAPITSIEELGLPESAQFNAFFPGYAIAMPPPLSEDAVEYADGTKATVKQMASDVTTFLAWAAEPELEERKRMGIKVVLFLIILTALLYAVKRRVWADLH